MTKLEMQIDSEQLYNIALVVECIEDYFRHHELDENVIFQVVSCVREGLNNIFEHATNDVMNKNINVACEKTNEKIIVELVDRGTAMESLPSTHYPDTETENGRGWFIIRNWMDEILYRRRCGENNLHMIRYIDVTT